jgi:hypothetical protein
MEQNRIWIYQMDRVVTSEESQTILEKCQGFCDGWNAHGTSLDAKVFVKHNTFIILSVNEKEALASGCSIDSSVQFLRELATEHSLELFDRLTIAFLLNDNIQFIPSKSLNEAYEKGMVNESSLAFNNTILAENELDTNWLIPLSDHWSFRMIPAASKV